MKKLMIVLVVLMLLISFTTPVLAKDANNNNYSEPGGWGDGHELHGVAVDPTTPPWPTIPPGQLPK